MHNLDAEYATVALQFANALMSGAYDAAYAGLSEDCRVKYGPDTLRQKYEQMLEYVGQPVKEIELMETLEDWSAKQPCDIGWAYISMSGDGFVEGVSVIVQSFEYGPKIRSIEWGRPLTSARFFDTTEK